MGASLRVQVRLHNAHDIECLSVLFVEHVGLVEAGLEVPLHRGLLKVWHWKMAVIHLAAILTPKAVPSLGPSVREVQCGLTSECGNEGQVGLLRSMQGVVVAKVALQDEWSERDHPRDPLEEGVKHGCDPHELRREGDGWLGCMPTALRTLRTSIGARRFGLAGDFLRIAAHNLLNVDRERALCLHADQGEGQEG